MVAALDVCGLVREFVPGLDELILDEALELPRMEDPGFELARELRRETDDAELLEDPPPPTDFRGIRSMPLDEYKREISGRRSGTSATMASMSSIIFPVKSFRSVSR